MQGDSGLAAVLARLPDTLLAGDRTRQGQIPLAGPGGRWGGRPAHCWSKFGAHLAAVFAPCRGWIDLPV